MFATYALPLVGLPPRLTVPLAAGAVVFLTGLNYVGVKPAAVTQNIFTVLKLAALAALIVAGLSAVSFTALDRPPPPSTSAPAAAVMRAVLGPAGGTLIAAGIAASTFGFLNLVILVTPRVFQAMAADGVFFSWLAELHPVYRTPSAAIVLQGAWAIVLTVSYGTFSQLVDYVAFGDWIFFGLTVAGLFVYRRRD